MKLFKHYIKLFGFTRASRLFIQVSAQSGVPEIGHTSGCLSSLLKPDFDKCDHLKHLPLLFQDADRLPRGGDEARVGWRCSLECTLAAAPGLCLGAKGL